MIEEKESLCLLFEFYKNLLTENQVLYFEQYYFLDISLNEIAEQTNISKQAVKDSLDKAKNNLFKYENALHLAKKYIRYNDLKKDKNSMQLLDYTNALEKLMEE